MNTAEFKANQAAFRGDSRGDFGLKQSWGSDTGSSTDDALPDGVLVGADGTPLFGAQGHWMQGR